MPCCRGYTFQHLLVFMLTFFSYAFFHATRKTLSNVKSSISAEWTNMGCFENSSVWLLPNQTWNCRGLFSSQKTADPFLGYMDTGFMVTYSLGLICFGCIGDRFSPKKVLSIGMICSGIVVYIFGFLTEYFHYYNAAVYVILIMANGLCQSVGWPTVIAIMSYWFGKSSRGFIFGLWSSCASVGNIIGALVTSSVLSIGYEYAFLLTSTLLLGLGIMNLCGLDDQPPDTDSYEIHVPEPNDAEGRCCRTQSGEEEPLLGDGTRQKPKPEEEEGVTICQAVALPGVVACAMSYACLKLVNYSFFFWLPLYMKRSWGLSESKSDQLSIWYDIGGIVGGSVGGFISDRLGYRAVVVLPMMIISLPVLYIFNVISFPEKNVIISLLFVAGFFIGGASNLISSAISADLGQQRTLKNSKKALCTVTGIIDGFGSFGAAIGQISLPHIEVNMGWSNVFWMFIVTSALTCVFLYPIVRTEYREWRYGIPDEENDEEEILAPPLPPPTNYALPPPSYDEIS